eukprot:15441715-Alexandrium_andersonii.AAC.1
MTLFPFAPYPRVHHLPWPRSDMSCSLTQLRFPLLFLFIERPPAVAGVAAAAAAAAPPPPPPHPYPPP